MTQTKTFQEWYADFQRRFYFGEFPNQRYGQAFVNALHDAGKHTQANSLLYTKDDPFYSDVVTEDTYGYLSRVWDWPQG